MFAELQGVVKEKIEQFGLGPAWLDERTFPTIGAAADAYREATGSTWDA